MQQEKNYYILLPLLSTNILQVYAFVENEKDNLENIGNNNVLLPIIHPKNIALLCYQIELKESLANQYRLTLESLSAEIYKSNEAYLLQYPPPNLESEF